MGNYRLSNEAKAGLLEIYEFTERTFGEYQAEAYQAGLGRTFGLLADFPRMGASVDDLMSGLRRFRFQSHSIFYSERSDHIFVHAVLHSKLNVRRQLFE